VSARIPDSYLDLFRKRAIGHLATIMPDGSPQVTPVWVDYDGKYLLVNSKAGRRKNANMLERPQVAIDIVDPDNPYRYLMVRGRVVEIIENGNGHIDALAQRYLGVSHYPWADPGESRQIFKILPEHVVTKVIMATAAL
jgi:PPOX class probable F420-dependent enzyme